MIHLEILLIGNSKFYERKDVAAAIKYLSNSSHNEVYDD